MVFGGGSLLTPSDRETLSRDSGTYTYTDTYTYDYDYDYAELGALVMGSGLAAVDVTRVHSVGASVSWSVGRSVGRSVCQARRGEAAGGGRG